MENASPHHMNSLSSSHMSSGLTILEEEEDNNLQHHQVLYIISLAIFHLILLSILLFYASFSPL